MLVAAFAAGWGFASAARADVLEVDVGRGPVTVHYPAETDAAHPAPLLVLLHGFTGTGPGQEAYFGLLPYVEDAGVIYAYPDGTSNPDGDQFWNATDACCDFYGSDVDDSAYLLDLVTEIRARLAVDPWRVHFAGHSNGGFMSYRMACDHSDVIASITSLAGATFDDPADCSPVGPVHVLQIHGTADTTIWYDGGVIGPAAYPGAVATTETWADAGACDLVPDGSAPPRDLDAGIPGAETTVLRYREGCAPASSAELWTIEGGSHVPWPLAEGFRAGVVGFALTHRKAGLVFMDEQTLEWPPLRWAERYVVYRGDLARLADADHDGLPDSGYGECVSGFDPDATDTTLTLGDDPPPGGGWFYVVGFVEADGTESILGTTSAGRARGPSAPCP
jgi:polyhydroxybutyrate depolymerase